MNNILSLLLLGFSTLVYTVPLTGQIHLSDRIVEASCHTVISSTEGQVTFWQNGKAVAALCGISREIVSQQACHTSAASNPYR
jgi:hypothetical protein